MSNNDVLKALEVKNKEIYLNKLNIDLDNNYDVINITLDNFTNLFTDEITNKILDIECSQKNKDTIKENVCSFQNKIDSKFKEEILNRNKELKESISIDEMNYDDEISKKNKKIMNNIEKYYLKSIDSLISIIGKEYEDYNKIRLEEYMKNLNLSKYLDKLNSLLTSTSIILCNNYKESYKKYLEMNEKTLKI